MAEKYQASDRTVFTFRCDGSSFATEPGTLWFTGRAQAVVALGAPVEKLTWEVSEVVDRVLYMLECSDGSLYTGITTDLEARLVKHSDGSASKYTASKRPVRLVFSVACPAMGKGAWLSLELKVKALTRRQKEQFIAGEGELWETLRRDRPTMTWTQHHALAKKAR